MRPLALIAIVTFSLGSLTSAAMAEPPAAVKADSPVIATAKAGSLNRMGLGFYRSLRVNRAGTGTAFNASLKSAAPSADTAQTLNVDRAAFANRKAAPSVSRAARQPLQALAGDGFSQDELSPAVPSTARMNKLR